MTESLSRLATKKRDLEIRNDELVRINARLNANYKVLQATISELSADKKELVNHNIKLQNSLDYLREFAGYGDLVWIGKQKPNEKICAESGHRNRIFEARVPVQMEGVHANDTTTTNVRTAEVDFNDLKDDTCTLGLNSDRGTTLKSRLAPAPPIYASASVEIEEQRKEQSKKERSKKERSKKERSKKGQSKKEQSKKEQSKKSKKEQSKKEQAKSEQSKKERSKKERSKKERSKKERSKKGQSKKEQSKKEQSKKSKKEQSKKEQAKSEQSKKEQSKEK
ncbi:hypothetical protein F1880_005645 [Penicillium rolfsii]|nr:hypothetical protein F1880_005645 [Penicillium rolfsii]